MQTAFDDAANLLNQFKSDPQTFPAMEAISQAISQCFEQGGKLLLCGNGGSLADAMHVAEEFSGHFRLDRAPLPAIALSDPAHMSCVANDYSFDEVFSRQVRALAKPEDLLICFSTSGNSRNLIRAAEEARAKSVRVISALGREGGDLIHLSDIVLMAPGDGSDRIQEIHMLAFHAMIEDVEERMFGGG